jgi:hypothetical protein
MDLQPHREAAILGEIPSPHNIRPTMLKQPDGMRDPARPMAGGYAFLGLALRMQDVRPRSRRGPLTALTDCRFKFQRRLVTLLA